MTDSNSLLAQKAHDALLAYWRQSPGWRSLWREVLEEWAARIGGPKSGDVTDSEAALLSFMLNLISDALADAEAHISQPLTHV